MDFFKRYPLLATILTLCVVAFAAETFFMFRERTQDKATLATLDKSQVQLAKVLASEVAPTDANKVAAQSNLDALDKRYDEIINALSHTGTSIPAAPSGIPELQVQINQYVNAMKDLCKTKKVLLPSPDFTFGMGQYYGPTAKTPATDKVPVVFRQLYSLRYILENLIKYKGDEQKMMLVSVDREDVTATGANSATQTAAKETFTVPPLVSVRGPKIDTLAFRIVFIGLTADTRSLLNILAQFQLPLLVRSIDVEPAKPELMAQAESLAHPGGALSPVSSANTTIAGREPVIKDNLSQFTVIIEYFTVQAANP